MTPPQNKPEGDSAETVVLRATRVRRVRSYLPAVLGGILVVAVLATGWAVWRWDNAPSVPATGTGVAQTAAMPLPLASPPEILADSATGDAIFALKANPHVVVIDFATLHHQAEAFNRMAVLVEKIGEPHDRVLNDADLAAAIRGSGDRPETYYYGHDYSAGDVSRFFALARRDKVTLTDEERRLAALARQQGWLGADGSEPAAAAGAGAVGAGTVGAVISLPRPDPAAGVDAAMRATILRHEMAHGEYFTNPVYAAYVAHFWRDTMTADDRDLFRAFLSRNGYDPALEDLMRNEMQAYLVHTRDPHFFGAAALGVTEAHLAAMQAAFMAGMPPGWLRDSVPVLQ